MTMDKLIYRKYPKSLKNITFNNDFLESRVFDLMGKNDMRVLIYFYGMLFWGFSKSKRHYISTNNGDIKVSLKIMAKNLNICRKTAIKARNNLITWGLIRIAHYGGNNQCHIYRILCNFNWKAEQQVCRKHQERWREFSDKAGEEKNWSKEIPRISPNLHNGFKKKIKTPVEESSLNQFKKLHK